jgi:O-antigen/teichoic acid export membrane protein
MLGPAALAVYNIGLRLMEIVEIPLRSFAATAMPSLSAAFNKPDKEEVVYILKKYTGVLTMLLIPAAILLLYSQMLPFLLLAVISMSALKPQTCSGYL